LRQLRRSKQHERQIKKAAEFVERYERDAERLRKDAALNVDDRDACGVGLIAAINGEPSRQVVEAGIEALKALWHRGTVDANGMTGDGAGILVEIPQEFSEIMSRALATLRATVRSPSA
jgi:glutamate synthase (NADPH/NADH) large chain